MATKVLNYNVIVLLSSIYVIPSTANTSSNPAMIKTNWIVQWYLYKIAFPNFLNNPTNQNISKCIFIFNDMNFIYHTYNKSKIYKRHVKSSHVEDANTVWLSSLKNVVLEFRTYNVDRQVPDSAGTATAYLCGVKANIGTLGVGPEVMVEDCGASLQPEHQATSILKWAQLEGKATGIVTTTRVTHATPAASYSHSASRRWEYDAALGANGQNCKDIADQLVNGETGRNINVILGGGRSQLGAHHLYPKRRDGRDLTKEWLQDKHKNGVEARYVTDINELASVDTNKTDYLLGLFSDTHLSYEGDRTQQKPIQEPSLTDMALTAIRMLSKNMNGFFLLVEGGRIDHALHGGKPRRALEEIVSFDNAIDAALKELDLEETLVVVTADHSHVMTLNGYPERGNDILGVAANVANDGLPYSTLMFTNGPGYDHHVVDNKAIRGDPTRSDQSRVGMAHPDYRSQSAVPKSSETHGGEDVAVYAVGPMSHLFHHVHEQNYVAHVMAFAACVGPSKGDKCDQPDMISNEIDSKLPGLQREATKVKGHLGSLPAFSDTLQQRLNNQQHQLISTLGFEVVPRMTAGIENENHVD
ncbi:unnamed protein product, partial [Meganyctiphanes norvegica]